MRICVWCWHHIIDMAEKDQTEGRCPACRTIYEKEKIVAMQANCGRTMMKISSKKSKPPKAKPKANEVKKDLTNVRVMQRKMAYVIGLPLSLADEDILVRKEYFGQYGKVTKVSLSRTAGGAIQQFANDTCSVYITFSKEEEALRCIQSVHGFVLEGRFLRASFGTAKYCHAWLKNMPCNNPACLYLHSIGADDDSFGKDEVAAVHTRSRVQQIVGATNNVVKRSGHMLPPPVDDICNGSSAFTDKPTIRSGISDASHGSANSSGDINIPLTSKEKEGANAAVANKTTTFVDVVGRPNCAALEKDRYIPEDKRISSLCSEVSSVAINGNTQAADYSFPTTFKMSHSNHTGNGSFENIPDDPSFLSDDQGSNDSQRAYFGHPSYPAIISEVLSGPTLLHEKTHSVNCFTVDHNPVHNHGNEAALPIRCVNSILTDSCQEMKFQNSAKSDRIYRSSNSFSNEEIVEHLRRIDDGGLNNDKENSILDAVESSIISNIMAIGLDSCEDSLTMPKGLSEFLDETDGLGGSSWSSMNSDQSGYSFTKQDIFANQMAGSILPEYGDNKEQYLCKPQYPVTRSQSFAPPGFSLPSRDPPPGFSTSGRTGSLSRASSGTGFTNGSSFPNNFLQPSSTRFSSMDDNDFFDPSLLNYSKGNRSFETRSTSNPRLSAFEDESRLWLLMQQSASAHPETNFSQMFPAQNPPAQQEPSYKGHMGNGLSGLDEIYGLSSRRVNEHQNYDQSFFTHVSQQTYANGHISNINGYRHSVDEVQQRKGEVGSTEFQRNERLGVDYFPGYGDLMFNSSDVYTRVFGL
ncbi:ccr4-not transcription complex subunit 4 [Phtheirospermum japonicum]|uniref:Ccr4-not transcription complex subunit 4 n=1 Tax=Phtheirospermum japonicum TaxID=374723 RepID=A0A830CF45_9LAMI|nr:ccr4-not transcription complex subunit 4 [Phtheirospermum japonicum]